MNNDGGVYLNNDLIWLTVSKYELFIEHGRIGVDAMQLYLHLMYTARRQATNSVWANNKYIRQGLKWGKDRLLKAKSLLFDLDLIEQRQRKNEAGRFEKTYIIVKTSTVLLEPNTGGLETGHPSTRLPVSDPKCFNQKEKCFNQKESIVRTVLEAWNNEDILIKHEEKVVNRYLKLKHFEIIEMYGVDKVVEAIKLYAQVLRNPWQKFDYRWQLWKFIQQDNALPVFLPEAKPLEMLIDEEKKEEYERKKKMDVYLTKVQKEEADARRRTG